MSKFTNMELLNPIKLFPLEQITKLSKIWVENRSDAQHPQKKKREKKKNMILKLRIKIVARAGVTVSL